MAQHVLFRCTMKGVQSLDYTNHSPSMPPRGLSPIFASSSIRTRPNLLEQNQIGGATRSTFNAEISLKNLPVPLPSTRAEQEAIAEALSDADALIESLEQLLAKKRHIKQGAMQELLTGKKRLPGFSGKWALKGFGEIAQLA